MGKSLQSEESCNSCNSICASKSLSSYSNDDQIRLTALNQLGFQQYITSTARPIGISAVNGINTNIVIPTVNENVVDNVTNLVLTDPLVLNNITVNDTLSTFNENISNSVNISNTITIGNNTISSTSDIDIIAPVIGSNINNDINTNNLIFTSSITPLTKTLYSTTSSSEITAPSGNGGILYYNGSVIKGVTDIPNNNDVLKFNAANNFLAPKSVIRFFDK